MKIIKTLNDFKKLKKSNSLDKEYLELIKKHLIKTWQAYQNGDIKEQPHKEVAYLVILEDNEELQKEAMETIGVPYHFTETAYEYIDQVEYKGNIYYVIGILRGNSFLMEVFIKESHLPKIKDWLRENSVTPDYYNEAGLNIDDIPF